MRKGQENGVQINEIRMFFCSLYFAVFLKYYHVEHLAKLYEEQLRKIVLVQSCVRRWLARVHYRRTKMRIAKSAMTVQRYVRGWLTRKRLQQMRAEWEKRQIEEQRSEQRRQSIKERDSMFSMFDFMVFFLLGLNYRHYNLNRFLNFFSKTFKSI